MIASPTWLVVLAAVLAVLLVVGLWSYFTAARLNRLHIRTDSARLTLEGALHARAMLIATLRPDLKKQADRVSRVPLQATDMGAHSEAENSLLVALDATVIEHRRSSQPPRALTWPPASITTPCGILASCVLG